MTENHILIENIGNGAFSKVYKAETLYGSIAIKQEKADIKRSLLEKEYDIYKKLVNIPGIPDVYWYGHDKNKNNVMYMQLLGNSLSVLFKKNNYKFRYNTILNLGIQMLCIIKKVHNNNIIHRDIKPHNFVIGEDNQLYLIDFGLAKHYKHNGKHIKKKIKNGLTGTAKYVSINTHDNIEQSRRDDLESIFYVLIYFCNNSLPWDNVTGDDKLIKYKKISEIKKKTKLSQLCTNKSKIFSQCLSHCRALQFEDIPNYDYMISLLNSEKNKYHYNDLLIFNIK